MTAVRGATIAARIPVDLREDLERIRDELRDRGVRYAVGRPADLSYVIRAALRGYADLYAAGTGLTGNGRLELDVRVDGRGLDRTLGSLDGRPAVHAGGPDTERQAAELAWPRALTLRRRALERLHHAGASGLTGDDLDAELGGYNGRRRLSELKAGGWVEARLGRELTPLRRRTRAGALADVYVLTPAARERLDAEEAHGT